MDERPLGELLEVIIDHRGKTPRKLGGDDFTSEGVRVVSAIHIKGGRIEWGQRERYVPHWMFEKWMPVRLRHGDVLLTSEAPLGAVAQVPSDGDLVLSQRLFALRGKAGILDSTYLRYFLESAIGQDRLRARASGTTVTGIRQAELVKVPIPVPPFDEQRQTASVLGAVDGLVETNRVQTLAFEALARILAATADRNVALSDLAAPTVSKQVEPSGSVEHYSLPAFDDGATPELADGSAIQSQKLPLHEPCVLLSRLNPKWERCWMVYPGANAVASTEFIPLLGVMTEPEEIWAVTSAPAFWEQMRTRVTGTTGSHQRVDKQVVLTLEVPDVRSLSDSVRQYIVNLVRAAQALRDESDDLSRTRDELLPLLMTGRIRVSTDLAVA